MLAGECFAHARADARDDTCALVAQDHGISAVPFDVAADVGAANGNGFHLQKHVAGARVGRWQLPVCNNAYVIEYSCVHSGAFHEWLLMCWCLAITAASWSKEERSLLDRPM